MAWWAWLAKLGSGAKAGAAKAATGSKIAKGISAAGKTSAAGSKIASGINVAKTTQAAGGKIASGLKSAGNLAAKNSLFGKKGAVAVNKSKGFAAMMAAGQEDVMKGSSAGGAESAENIVASTPADTSMLDSLNTKEAQKPYKPSAGELGRQVGANIYEQGMSRYAGPVRTIGDITGNKSMSNFANRVTDTTSFRSGGKLSYKPEEISPTEARERGLNEMSQIGQHQGKSQLAVQRQQKEEYEQNRQAELRKYYPNLF